MKSEWSELTRFGVQCGITNTWGKNYGKWIYFRGSRSDSFSFAFLLGGGQLLKKRICSCRSKFFPLRVDPIWFDFYVQGSKLEETKVVSIYKSGRKSWCTHTRNPIALRMAKTPRSFGHSECNRANINLVPKTLEPFKPFIHV